MSDAETGPAPLTITFDGHPVTSVVWNGKLVWVAAQVGESLGYTDGRLADRITGDWSEDFIAGTDYETITNGVLRAFKDLAPELGASRAPSLTILYESGLHLALLKTRKPAGRRLRRLLATEVLPQLARTGQYAPAPPPPPAPPPALPLPDLPPPILRRIAPLSTELCVTIAPRHLAVLAETADYLLADNPRALLDTKAIHDALWFALDLYERAELPIITEERRAAQGRAASSPSSPAEPPAPPVQGRALAALSTEVRVVLTPQQLATLAEYADLMHAPRVTLGQREVAGMVPFALELFRSLLLPAVRARNAREAPPTEP